MTATPETIELIAAVLALKAQRDRNLADDGRESRWELLNYVDEIPEIKRALSGIGRVPVELAALTPESVEPLVVKISELLAAWGVQHRRQDITAELVRAVVDMIPVVRLLVRRWQTIISMPPAAELVTDA